MNIVLMCCPGRETMVADLRKRLGPQNIVMEIWDLERQGAAVCALRAFQAGLEAFKEQPFTVMQDDALPCWNFTAYAGSFMEDVKAGTIINWYAHPWTTSDKVQRQPEHYDPRFINSNGKDYIVSLCTSWPRVWAERIALRLADAVEHDPRDDMGRRHGDDAYIAQVLGHYGATIWTHTPSLVQHRGDESMVAGRFVHLGVHDGRSSKCFVGAMFNALWFTGKTDVHWRRLAKEKRMVNCPNCGHEIVLEAAGVTKDDEGRHLAVEHLAELPALKAHVGNEFALPPPDLASPFVKGTQCNECGAAPGSCPHTTGDDDRREA